MYFTGSVCLPLLRRPLARLAHSGSSGVPERRGDRLPLTGASVAQGIEQRTPNALVAGSNPAGGTMSRRDGHQFFAPSLRPVYVAPFCPSNAIPARWPTGLWRW